MSWIVEPSKGLVEMTPAPVIWVDDIGAIWLADNAVTTYYYVERPALFGEEPVKNVELIVKRSSKAFIKAANIADGATKFIIPRPARPNGWHGPRLVP